MASLTMQDGSVISDEGAIARALAPLGIALAHWPTGDDPELRALLDSPRLDDAGKERVLALLDHTFQQLRESQGYQSRDLIVLHPDVPGLDELLAKFERCHTHADDEVRYIVDGEGVFGFVLPDGSQVELLVEPGEYVNVPTGTEHWFHLTERRRIKAIRYFVDTTGWTPEYTGTSIAFGRGER